MRVLLLDEGFISGLATARGLVRVGCAVDVIAATGGSAVCATRGGRWRLAPKIGDPRLLALLDREVAAGEYDVIYPITEPLQSLLWDAKPAWSDRVFPQVDEGERPIRRDKRLMSELVAEAGAAIPRQLTLASEGSLELAIAELGLPIVIKGSTGRGGSTTHICRTHSDAQSATRVIVGFGVVPFAQEFIDGVTFLAGGVFERGTALRFYAAAKSVQHPRQTGPAAELTSVVNDELRTVALRAFSAANVTGLASIDLIRDHDGRFHFLELNPRPWGSIAATRIAGVDLFGPLVQRWRSETVIPRLTYRGGIRTHVFPLCLLSGAYWRSVAGPVSLLATLFMAVSQWHVDLRFVRHVVERLVRVGRNWPHPHQL